MTREEFMRAYHNNDVSDQTFRAVVQFALEKFPTREMADEMGVSESTLQRWTGGVARPHPVVRTHFYKYIAGLL